MKPVRAAVVGVGYLGKFHAEKYAGLADAELVAVVDADIGRAREIAAKHNAAAYSDYRELIGKVDAVSIVVPTNLHHAIAKDFLLAGVDVLVEKPITVTLQEADDLVAAAKNNNRILQVGHLERFNGAIVALNGILNKPMFIESHRLAPFKDRGIEVDVILDIMIHDIDIILNLVGAPVTSIHAVGVPVVSSQTNDIANVRLEFATGCIANITASRISVKEMRKIRIFQQDAYISIDYAAQDIEVYRKMELGDQYDTPQIMYDDIEIKQADSLMEEIRSFVNAVRTRCAPAVPGEAGRDALKIALEIVHQVEARKQGLPQTG
jgi:predicted dehydrogenase